MGVTPGNLSTRQNINLGNFVVYFTVQDQQRAIEFKKYLKSGCGRAFAGKRPW
jgi:hypothetical protein